MDWGMLSAYLKEVRRAARQTRDLPADASLPDVSADRVLAFRVARQHLRARLSAGSVAEAARGGLKDSAPRDALLALHARVEGVGPHDWEHEDLVQIWFRWADHVIPRVDADVFTRGALPRDPAAAAAIDALGGRVAALLGEGVTAPGAISARVGFPEGITIRAANVSGRFFIRWDARTVTLRPAPAPVMDPEDARLELARRFLRWLGPASARRFARWAGVSREDAEATWSALSVEIVPVAVIGRERSILAEDEQELRTATHSPGVRLLPMGDPLLSPDPAIPIGEVPKSRTDVPRRVLNSLIGRIFVDGRFVGAWGRRQNVVTIWLPGGAAERERVLSEVAGLAEPIGKTIDVREI